jgi:hypothetical protein
MRKTFSVLQDENCDIMGVWRLYVINSGTKPVTIYFQLRYNRGKIRAKRFPEND